MLQSNGFENADDLQFVAVAICRKIVYARSSAIFYHTARLNNNAHYAAIRHGF